MSSVNPYQASTTPAEVSAERISAPAVSVAKSFLIVLTSAGSGALLGLIAGSLIGLILPDYYHAVFDDPNLNPVQVGSGLGVTQGFGLGFVLGCVVLLAVAIARRRATGRG